MRNNETVMNYLNSNEFQPPITSNFPLAQVLSSMQDGVVVVDKEGTIVYANPSYTRILGVPVNRVIGRHMRNVERDARILTVLKTGRAILQEPIFLKSLGVELVADATPLYNKQGEIIGGVTIFKKSGEVVQFYEALRRLEVVKTEQPTYQERDEAFSHVVGEDKNFLDLIHRAAQAAKSPATVLLSGESGVGKEIFAEAIHKCSERADKPFVKINCAALPDSILESELFGYEEGTFTGAKRGGKCGKIEAAQGGTLFLDEIGDMSLNAQTKVLRVLQEREFERLGGHQTIRVNIRVIAATNQDLKLLVKKGKFREDLFYRINVIPLNIPALRERRQDTGPLVRYFLHQCEQVYGKKLTIDESIITNLESYHWPGNVRQLRNAVEHAVVFSKGSSIRFDAFPEEIKEHLEADMGEAHSLREEMGDNVSDTTSECEKILEALKQTNYNRSKAIELLGISRRTFYQRIKKYGISL
ncbi:sigma-54 interaction domain-containing protein [Alicyclobacillus dauci]|uniref:Sigma 54-interacting transcriptional regulator n=1 Tax=Alicyclobacillus dauci TaxID=1475485 RepID=A0ABY6Z1G6_9BACL|nr:sigma 54-interacting transcriptional regulator [Alicyclobacillus dauci]WAH36201.1 sigma 54-interacting transcriptional regulator [Alicyclobacillus dauci]